MSDELREKFGEIYLDTTYQNKTRRIGFIRRKSDGAILTYHVVTFDERGIRIMGEFHRTIVAGALLGETIKRSSIRHSRLDSKVHSKNISEALRDIFGTSKKACRYKTVTYRLGTIPYVHIEEYYNPRFTAVPR